MLDILEKIIKSVLSSVYQPFWFSLLTAVLLMFVYMFAREHGVKTLLLKWWNEFKKSSSFRILFLFMFYLTLVLFRTLLNRNLWANPLSDVIGPWGLHNREGEFTTEAIENFMLFIPLIVLLFCAVRDKIIKTKVTFFKILGSSAIISFGFSMAIEFTQLFLRLGNFQLSDLFHNTLGGIVGGIIYWAGYKIKEKTDSKKR